MLLLLIRQLLLSGKLVRIQWLRSKAKAQVITAIRALELEDYITSSWTPPKQYIEIFDENAVIKAIKVNPAYRFWKRADQLLLCWLRSTISEGVLVLQLKQQLQTIKKGSMFISDYIMKIKAIEDALETAGHTITDADLVLSMLSGLGHEYDPMVVLVSHQSKTMNLQDVEYLLMLHEQRIEQLNTSSQIEANVASANFASNSDGGKNQRGGGIQSRGNNRGRGRGNKGGKWNNQKLQCQLCQKPGHSALQCYKRFD
ncbi:hypothetical protein ACOSQ4_013691 [Xanthoceras sorbifolium]